jgi:Fungal trichothecene efflux pump (TRI12)
MLLMALEWGGTEYPWNSATIIGLFCGAGGTLILFVAWEYRTGDTAMIPLSMVRKRIVWCSCLVIGCFFGSLLVFSYYLPIYFQAVKGVSPSRSGVYVLPGILSQMLMAITSGFLGKCRASSRKFQELTRRLVGKLGYYLPWSLLSAIVVAIASGLISTFKPNTTTAVWVGYQFLAGVGRGCGLQMVSLSHYPLVLHDDESNRLLLFSPSLPSKTPFLQSKIPLACHS